MPVTKKGEVTPSANMCCLTATLAVLHYTVHHMEDLLTQCHYYWRLRPTLTCRIMRWVWPANLALSGPHRSLE